VTRETTSPGLIRDRQFQEIGIDFAGAQEEHTELQLYD
jgi:hypothetical protein